LTTERRLLRPLITTATPSLLDINGVGPDVAAISLVAAGDNPDRLRNEAAFARLCGVAPLEASSGRVVRHPLNRGGNRQANHALYRIILSRLSSDPATKRYVHRRTTEGNSTAEIVRVLRSGSVQTPPPHRLSHSEPGLAPEPADAPRSCPTNELPTPPHQSNTPDSGTRVT
jgi:hypothetical protein